MNNHPAIEGKPVKVDDVLWLLWLLWHKTFATQGRIRLATVSEYGWTMYGSPCQYPYSDLSWQQPIK